MFLSQKPQLLTTSNGEPVEIRDIMQINSDQFSNQYNLDLQASFDGENIPERVVHAKGSGAIGYLEITNDVSEYTSANLFQIGKKTPLVARFSTAHQSRGGSDVARDLKGAAFKFYTEEGNLDLLCLQTPVYLHKDPMNFPLLVHAFKRNPKTFVQDQTAIWDFITLRPDAIHTFLWINSDYGSPNGYRKMDAFPIHAYEINNKKGDKYYVRFNFRTEQGIENLTPTQAAQIQSKDLDYYNRDLYNSIARNEFPAWKLDMYVLTEEDLKTVPFDPFDTTRIWLNGTYKVVPIGRLVLDRNPDNQFRDIEQAAFNPANLVPGIPGPVDIIFKAQKVAYRDTQNYRLGRNHNKIEVNKPKYAKTYNRDGKPPVAKNMEDTPPYYPNSFNGPIPYIDEARPKKKLIVIQRNTPDLGQAGIFYNTILQTAAERQRLADVLITSLSTVLPTIRDRSIKMLYLVSPDLGKRVEVGLKAALLAASSQ